MATAESTIAVIGQSGALLVEALTWMLTKHGVDVGGVYGALRELPSAADARERNLRAVIVDADDPAADTPAVIELRSTHPDLKIVLLCERASPAVIACAMDARAEGVVLKSDSPEEVVLALRLVLDGCAVMPAGWHDASLRENDATPLAGLGGRAREVLELAAHGLSNREIAERLVISPNTVKFHLRKIYSRLGVHNRVQATQAMSQLHLGR